MVDSLIIHKEGTTIKVRLKTAEGVLDELVFPLDPVRNRARAQRGPKDLGRAVSNGVDIHFDTVLLTSIDKLLKRNRIGRVSLLSTFLEGFEDDSSMSAMIARTVIEALKIK